MFLKLTIFACFAVLPFLIKGYDYSHRDWSKTKKENISDDFGLLFFSFSFCNSSNYFFNILKIQDDCMKLRIFERVSRRNYTNLENKTSDECCSKYKICL